MTSELLTHANSGNNIVSYDTVSLFSELWRNLIDLSELPVVEVSLAHISLFWEGDGFLTTSYHAGRKGSEQG